MSYILDALRKAESERNLAGVPTIHARHASSAALMGSMSVRRKVWIWIALTVLTEILIVLAWFKPWQPARIDNAPAAVSQQAVRNGEQAISARQPAPSVPPLAAATQPEPDMLAAAPQATTALPAVKAPLRKPARSKARPKRDEQSAAGTASHVPKNPMHAQAAAPPSSEPVPRLRELPEQIQSEIPQFRIGGYIYSSNRADRTILINTQLLREGDQVAPNLTLEKMLPNGAIFNYKGYRYRTTY